MVMKMCLTDDHGEVAGHAQAVFERVREAE
jgi:hypothetical protein